MEPNQAPARAVQGPESLREPRVVRPAAGVAGRVMRCASRRQAHSRQISSPFRSTASWLR
jgi:hypothetical protein